MIHFLAAAAATLIGLSPLQRAAEARDTLGVNVHIEYTDSDYRDLGRVLADLHYLRIRNVRDAAPNPANQGQGGYAVLAKAGVRLELFVNGGPIAPALTDLDDLVRAAPGALVGVEGPNEVNNLTGFQFEGERDPHRAATRYQASLYAQVRADPLLANVPVLAFTDYPYTFGRADVQNEHPYQPADRAPGPALDAIVRAAVTRAPGQSVVFTETGYSTSNIASDVSNLAQSRLILTTLLDSLRAGVKRVYIYQLLDAYPDPSGAEHEKHFGLFTVGDAPKPAAKMLRRVSALLADEAPDASTFKPRAPLLSISGGGSDLRTLVLQKASGEQIVALWREAPVFASKPRSDLELAPELLGLEVREPHGAITIVDPVAGTQARLRAGGALTRIPIGSDPLLVRIEVRNAASR